MIYSERSSHEALSNTFGEGFDLLRVMKSMSDRDEHEPLCALCGNNDKGVFPCGYEECGDGWICSPCEEKLSAKE